MFSLKTTSILFQRNLPHLTRRTMATAPEKFEWIVVLPDNAGALAKRMEIRPKHLEGLKPDVESGFWKMEVCYTAHGCTRRAGTDGEEIGAFLEDVPKEGEGLKILGSVMVAVAASKEEVIEQLKKDTYSENNVWDFSKIQIYPFKCAFRNP